MSRNWLLAGTIIRHYEIKLRIAASGTGEVYLAKDHQQDRLAALKLLPALPGWGLERLQQFAQYLNQLVLPSHPNICQLYEAGVTEATQLFVALEYVQGKSLDDIGLVERS